MSVVEITRQIAAELSAETDTFSIGEVPVVVFFLCRDESSYINWASRFKNNIVNFQALANTPIFACVACKRIEICGYDLTTDDFIYIDSLHRDDLHRALSLTRSRSYLKQDEIAWESNVVDKQLQYYAKQAETRKNKTNFELVKKALEQLPKFYAESQYRVTNTDRGPVLEFRHNHWGTVKVDKFYFDHNDVLRNIN